MARSEEEALQRSAVSLTLESSWRRSCLTFLQHPPPLMSACGAGDQEQVLVLLLSSAEGEEECRNVVAECLGRLALLAPEKVGPCMTSMASTPHPHPHFAKCTRRVWW